MQAEPASQPTSPALLFPRSMPFKETAPAFCNHTPRTPNGFGLASVEVGFHRPYTCIRIREKVKLANLLLYSEMRTISQELSQPSHVFVVVVVCIRDILLLFPYPTRGSNKKKVMKSLAFSLLGSTPRNSACRSRINKRRKKRGE